MVKVKGTNLGPNIPAFIRIPHALSWSPWPPLGGDEDLLRAPSGKCPSGAFSGPLEPSPVSTASVLALRLALPVPELKQRPPSLGHGLPPPVGAALAFQGGPITAASWPLARLTLGVGERARPRPARAAQTRALVPSGQSPLYIRQRRADLSPPSRLPTLHAVVSQSQIATGRLPLGPLCFIGHRVTPFSLSAC